MLVSYTWIIRHVLVHEESQMVLLVWRYCDRLLRVSHPHPENLPSTRAALEKICVYEVPYQLD